MQCTKNLAKPTCQSLRLAYSAPPTPSTTLNTQCPLPVNNRIPYHITSYNRKWCDTGHILSYHITPSPSYRGNLCSNGTDVPTIVRYIPHKLTLRYQNSFTFCMSHSSFTRTKFLVKIKESQRLPSFSTLLLCLMFGLYWCRCRYFYGTMNEDDWLKINWTLVKNLQNHFCFSVSLILLCLHLLTFNFGISPNQIKN